MRTAPRRPAVARAVRRHAGPAARRAGRPGGARRADRGSVRDRRARTRHLALTVEASPGSNVVTAPPEWLDRLLGTLLDNACKYSPEGGAVRVTSRADGARVRLTVDDSGPGIPEEERPRIFDRFHRATQPRGGGRAWASPSPTRSCARRTAAGAIGTSPAGGASMSVSWPRAFEGHGEAATCASAVARDPGLTAGGNRTERVRAHASGMTTAPPATTAPSRPSWRQVHRSR